MQLSYVFAIRGECKTTQHQRVKLNRWCNNHNQVMHIVVAYAYVWNLTQNQMVRLHLDEAYLFMGNKIYVYE